MGENELLVLALVGLLLLGLEDLFMFEILLKLLVEVVLLFLLEVLLLFVLKGLWGVYTPLLVIEMFPLLLHDLLSSFVLEQVLFEL